MPSDAPFYAPAKRTRVGWLIAIAGGAGSGKTFSALRLATGLAGPTGTIAFADTENGRALYYDDDFKFLYHAVAEPFRPMKFEQAAVMAQREGHAVLIIDNYSHEHTGPGGVLAWHEEELSRLAGEDDAKRERVNQLAWVKPKMARKATLQRFWQLNAHIILCLQAERKTEQQKDPKTGKMKPVDIGFQPVCAAELPYFMTTSFLLDAKNPGVPIWPPLKIMGKVAPLFRPGQPLDEATGARIAAWARGEKPDAASATPSREIEKSDAVADPVPPPEPPPADEPPPSRRASGDAKEAEIEVGVEEMIRRFAEVRTRQQHLIVVTEDGFQKRLMWLKRNRRELFDRLNAAIKQCWARTDPARAQGELVP